MKPSSHFCLIPQCHNRPTSFDPTPLSHIIRSHTIVPHHLISHNRPTSFDPTPSSYIIRSHTIVPHLHVQSHTIVPHHSINTIVPHHSIPHHRPIVPHHSIPHNRPTSFDPTQSSHIIRSHTIVQHRCYLCMDPMIIRFLIIILC